MKGGERGYNRNNGRKTRLGNMPSNYIKKLEPIFMCSIRPQWWSIPKIRGLDKMVTKSNLVSVRCLLFSKDITYIPKITLPLGPFKHYPQCEKHLLNLGI
jgi:hypothetical protein